QQGEKLAHAFDQPVKRQHEEDQDHGGEQIAQHAEPEEPLVRGDVRGRRGRVARHEQFVGDVDEAQRAEQDKQQIPESSHSPWIADRAHVPSVVDGRGVRVMGRYGWWRKALESGAEACSSTASSMDGLRGGLSHWMPGSVSGVAGPSRSLSYRLRTAGRTPARYGPLPSASLAASLTSHRFRTKNGLCR